MSDTNLSTILLHFASEPRMSMRLFLICSQAWGADLILAGSVPVPQRACARLTTLDGAYARWN